MSVIKEKVCNSFLKLQDIQTCNSREMQVPNQRYQFPTRGYVLSSYTDTRSSVAELDKGLFIIRFVV